MSKVLQTSHSLTVLLEHVRAQLDMLSLGHLTPSIITPERLREALLEIQAKLPHHLRLPVDPTQQLWKYYSALGCATLLEDDKLLVLVPVPLLDRDSTFEIYQVMNLPFPYPKLEPEIRAVARYKVESEFVALNLARTKFMLLTQGEAEKCKNDTLGTCGSVSPIYVAGSHDLCILELFKKNKKGIRDHCQVEVLARVMLPKAISDTDGIWAVATQEEIELFKVCAGETTTSIRLTPSLFFVELPHGCGAHGQSISLPPTTGQKRHLKRMRLY